MRWFADGHSLLYGCSVTAAIRESAQQIQAALDTQVSALNSEVQQDKSKVSSGEQELKTKMDNIVANEGSHDEKQESKIAAIKASLAQGASRVQTREASLTMNITIAKRMMQNGMELLDAASSRDKPQLLAQVTTAVDAANAQLDDIVKDTQAELKHAVQEQLQAEEQSVEAERAAMAVKENLLDAEVARLSRGDTRFDAKWAADVNTIDQDLALVREGAHRNNTRIQKALRKSEDTLQREQSEAYGDNERAHDRQEFTQVENSDAANFRANITADIQKEQEHVERRMREAENGFLERAHTSFVGPRDREIDLKGNLGALKTKVARQFETRDQQITAINFTSATWIASAERSMSRATDAADEAVRASKAGPCESLLALICPLMCNSSRKCAIPPHPPTPLLSSPSRALSLSTSAAKTRSFQRIHHMKERLATLLGTVR